MSPTVVAALVALVVVLAAVCAVAAGGGGAAAKEHYGEPPGFLRAVHRDELGFRGWADMPGDFEGSSASSVSAYIERSA